MALLDHPSLDTPLDIEFSRVRGRVVVHLRGELDVSTTQVLRQRLIDLIDGQGNLSVVLELSGVTFIDSAGIGLVVGAHRRLREKGGSLVVSSPSRQVACVLDATGLWSTLSIAPG